MTSFWYLKYTPLPISLLRADSQHMPWTVVSVPKQLTMEVTVAWGARMAWLCPPLVLNRAAEHSPCCIATASEMSLWSTLGLRGLDNWSHSKCCLVFLVM